ncbi:4-coumarate--CoA ligase-like [Penaeus japonicus]|uniref:4-coumarate--CoA ligase-like n=1 Tax=Penaeus japonicus TaxID=27405 RepID=UPI001C70B79C|nr:4-coumarate--CoA ligase-like [Penaeus japonicus]
MASALNAVRLRLPRQISRSRILGKYLHTTAAGQNIVTSPIPDIELPSGNLTSLILNKVTKWGHHTASECSVTGRRYTYSQLVDGASKWAGMLSKMGMKKGDVLAVVMPNCPEYPIVLLGTLMAGVVVTTVNSNYTAGEIHRQLVDSGSKMILYDPVLESRVNNALELFKRPILTASNGPSTRSGALNLRHVFEDSSLAFADPVELSGNELALMPYSSGTTGPPKGVAITHNGFSSNMVMYMTPTCFPIKEATATSQGAFMCLLPSYHIYGILPITLVGLAVGINVVTVPAFDPNTFVKTISSHKMSTLHLVPPLLNFLLHSPSVTAESMAHLEHIVIGAAPVSQSAAQNFKDKVNKQIFFQEGYGMTEVLLTHVVPSTVDEVGTCGQLLPNVQARVVDTVTGENLKANEDGEIWVKTPSMMQGYFQNPSATAETIDAEGWLHTGDVGHYDERGFFKIVDRTKELVKVKGLQVSPSELEDLLRQCPAVVDVGVVGVPHDRLGEAPRAYVVTSKMVSEEIIHEFLEDKVAPHKKLVGGVCFVKELPKNATGKLLRRELRRMATEGAA